MNNKTVKVKFSISDSFNIKLEDLKEERDLLLTENSMLFYKVQTLEELLEEIERLREQLLTENSKLFYKVQMLEELLEDLLNKERKQR